jgi:predicted small metal-binding protein
MKHFSCGDVVAGCRAVFSAVDEGGILRQVAQHAARDHGIAEVSPELAQSVRDHITNTAVSS